MEKINAAVIGYGQRGEGNLKTVMTIDYVNIVAVCDAYKDRADAAAKAVIDSGRKKPLVFTDYKEILNLEDVNTVLIFSSWESHIRIAIEVS